MQIPASTLDWLLNGDIAIQYQVHRDLLGANRPDLQARIASEGWGDRFLAARNPDGHWGRGFYQPKWISTHYTLLDLRHLCLAPGHPQALETIHLILDQSKDAQGSINPHRSPNAPSDACINGMFLTYACYFGVEAEPLRSIIDYLIPQQMPDGGFNCEREYRSPVHSSVHTTLSALEGIHAYLANGYIYRQVELERIAGQAREFLLQHQLFRSHRSGEVIDPKMLLLSYPSRWRYDILRALDHFQSARVSYDPRLQPALDVLIKKQRSDGRWPVQAKHPGQVHFDMEGTGQPSRWNTLRALRVVRHYS
jgi:hypothetical protein